LRSLEPNRSGFICPKWYLDTYLNKINSSEVALITEAPVLHYLIYGQLRGWSISPFFDELRYNSHINSRLFLDNDNIVFSNIGLSHYLKFQNDQADFFKYFANDFYLQQLLEKKIIKSTTEYSACKPLLVHYLTKGRLIGLEPHPEWSESVYLENNSDVKLVRSTEPFWGWLHWCMHGRFENRISGMTTSRK
jgi:hypothetical protein